MARIEGVDLPRNKRVEIGLTYLFGIGLERSHEALGATGVNPDTRIKDLTDEEVGKLREYIGQNFRVEGDLRRDVQLNIKRLIELAATVGCGTAATCRYAANERAQIRAPARGRKRQWPVAVDDAALPRNRNNLDKPDGGAPSAPRQPAGCQRIFRNVLSFKARCYGTE